MTRFFCDFNFTLFDINAQRVVVYNKARFERGWFVCK